MMNRTNQVTSSKDKESDRQSLKSKHVPDTELLGWKGTDRPSWTCIFNFEVLMFEVSCGSM
jgi:hypothetical protein